MSFQADSEKGDILHNSIQDVLILTDCVIKQIFNNELESISNIITFPELVNPIQFPQSISLAMFSPLICNCFPLRT